MILLRDSSPETEASYNLSSVTHPFNTVTCRQIRADFQMIKGPFKNLRAAEEMVTYPVKHYRVKDP